MIGKSHLIDPRKYVKIFYIKPYGAMSVIPDSLY